MDGDASDLKLLLTTTAQEVEGLRGDPRLKDDVEGSRGAALRTHLIDLLDAIDHRVAQLPPLSAPESVRRAFARSVRQSIHVLRGAHVALPWIDATRSPHLNMGSLYLAEECATLTVGPDVDLVVVPNEEYMYSTTSWPFAKVIQGTPGFVPKTKRRPIVLNYPLGDSDRLLLHPIFAHELGHAACDEHRLVDGAMTTLASQPAFASEFEQVVTAMQSQWPSAKQAQVSGTVTAWLRAWLEEVICDHLATEVCGPAFIWAFAMFVMPFSYGEPSQNHPPNTLRAELAIHHLKRRDWHSYMKNIAPQSTGWLEGIGSDSVRLAEPPFDFFRAQFINNQQALQDLAIQVVGGAGLESGIASEEAAEAASLLDRLILPLDASRQLQPRAILTGGWEAAFRAHGDGPAGMVEALSNRGLQDLVGKAMELSVISKAWAELP